MRCWWKFRRQFGNSTTTPWHMGVIFFYYRPRITQFLMQFSEWTKVIRMLWIASIWSALNVFYRSKKIFMARSCFDRWWSLSKTHVICVYFFEDLQPTNLQFFVNIWNFPMKITFIYDNRIIFSAQYKNNNNEPCNKGNSVAITIHTILDTIWNRYEDYLISDYEHWTPAKKMNK